jgi:predicted PurR-regulated permease PerM
MDEIYFKKIASSIILITLIVLSFLLIKPILLAILLGAIFAFILAPVNKWLKKYIKSENMRAILISVLLTLLIILPIVFLAPVIINQVLKIYLASEQVDFVAIFSKLFPILGSSQIPIILQSIFDSSISSMLNSIAEFLSLDNIMNYFLKSLVVLFTFYFVLRDKEKIKDYIKSLLPFSKEVEKKLFERSSQVTSSVLYGQVVVGIFQGIVTGIGFFLFMVPNALFFTLLASLAGILPVIGTTLVWLPMAIYLLASGNTISAIGVTAFGLISSSIDNFLRPVIVSRKTKMHPAIVLVGMIGGLFFFGVLGFILGPLILAYLIILLEVYKNKRSSIVFIKENNKTR